MNVIPGCYIFAVILTFVKVTCSTKLYSVITLKVKFLNKQNFELKSLKVLYLLQLRTVYLEKRFLPQAVSLFRAAAADRLEDSRGIMEGLLKEPAV